MNSKKIVTIMAVLTFIAVPLGVFSKMQIKDAQHDIEIAALKKENVSLNDKIEKLEESWMNLATKAEVRDLSKKIDEMPQKIFNLMNSVPGKDN